MSYVITSSIDGYVLLPIECKADVLNFKIPTPVKPSLQEVMTLLIKQTENTLVKPPEIRKEKLQ
jgi:hypothetical protein